MNEDCVILMVKCPIHGKVKSRLSRTIGVENSTEFYRRAGIDILDAIMDGPFDTYIGYHPTDHEDCIRKWLGNGLGMIPQEGQDLGEKQADLLKRGFDLGYSRVCVMISDSPDIPIENINSAFQLLKRSDCVIGPSPDGDYYLIGFTRDGFQRELFINMEWSHGKVLQQMIARIMGLDIKCLKLDSWPDIDDIDDLKELLERNPPGTGPMRTMEFLRGLELV